MRVTQTLGFCNLPYHFHLGFLISLVKGEKSWHLLKIEMESCCATFGANSRLAIAGKSVLRDVENVFWGDRIRGGFNNNFLVTQLPKNLKSSHGVRKIKPGAAYSVLTSKNAPETLVSSTTL